MATRKLIIYASKWGGHDLLHGLFRCTILRIYCHLLAFPSKCFDSKSVPHVKKEKTIRLDWQRNTCNSLQFVKKVRRVTGFTYLYNSCYMTCVNSYENKCPWFSVSCVKSLAIKHIKYGAGAFQTVFSSRSFAWQ